MGFQWKAAALGALGGAVIAVAVVFGAAALDAFPHPDHFDGQKVRAYLLSHPQLLVEITNKLQEDNEDSDERSRQAAVDKLGLKTFFDPSLAYVTGPADAKITVVEFFDYNCVHCRNTFAAVKKFYDAHKDKVRFAFVDFPIFGKMSDAAARAAVAARRQEGRYIPFSFAMMGEKAAIDLDLLSADAKTAGLDIPRLIADMKDPAVDKTLAAAHALARQAKFDGTPTFIVNGRVHSGEIDEDTLKEMTGH